MSDISLCLSVPAPALGLTCANSALGFAAMQGPPGAGVALVGEIRMYAGQTPPAGWALCDGASVSRAANPALFAVLGTTFGAGDGSTTFVLPDLRGRAPVGVGIGDASDASAWALGAKRGAETHTLSIEELPSHDHSPIGVAMPGSNTNGGALTPSPNRVLGRADQAALYASQTNANTTLAPFLATPASVGADAPHTNLQPSLGVSFIIALG